MGQSALPYIQAGAQGGGMILGPILQSISAQKTRSYNNAMYYQQLADSDYRWNRENEYNLPINQRKRLEEAGLNPNLMYGTGQTSQAAQSHMPSATPQQQTNYQSMDLGRILSTFQDAKAQQVQIDNLKKQGQLYDQEIAQKAIDNLNKKILGTGYEIDNRRKQFDYEQLERLKDISYEAAATSLKKNQNELSYLTDTFEDRKGSTKYDYKSKKQEYDYRNDTIQVEKKILAQRLAGMEWDNMNKILDGALKSFEYNLNKRGLTKSDPYVLRIAQRTIENIKEAKPEERKEKLLNLFTTIPSLIYELLK